MMDSIDTFNERLATVRQQLHELFESGEAAIWLLTPQTRLRGHRPVELLWSERGYQEVSATLQQVLDGAFI